MSENKPLNRIYGQSIIYFPFRYENKPNNQKSIKVDKVTNDSENHSYILYDDFIKYVDSQYNLDGKRLDGFKKDDEKYHDFSRSFYSLALKDINKEDRSTFEPSSKYEILYDKIKESLAKKRNDVYKIKKEEIENNDDLSKDKKEEILKEYADLSKKFVAEPSKVNLILYNKTKIGFLELFVDYTYIVGAEEEDKVSKLIANLSSLIGIDVGYMKKIFFVKDNEISNKNKHEISDTYQQVDNDLERFVKFIMSLDIKEDIFLTKEDVSFQCREYKKRSMSYSYLLIPKDDLDKLKDDEDSYNRTMMCIGRTHDSNSRTLKKDFKLDDFIITDETGCIFCVTNSSFGLIININDRSENDFCFNLQHMSEQYVFFTEYCLHLRMYLYDVIENYRKRNEGYYKLKAQFTENITRYNISLISEVEPQKVYEKMLGELRIKKLYDDAEKSLNMLQAKEEQTLNTYRTILTLSLSAFGLFGIIVNLTEFINALITFEELTSKIMVSVFIFFILIFYFIYRKIKNQTKN